MVNIVLCGGSGTRLWPISRKLMPKQFVKIFNENSLFELTLERNRLLCDEFFIISNETQYFLALDQSKNYVNNRKFLLEPLGKNTAPAIALACFSLNKDDIVLVTPSDHLIKDENEYKRVVKKAKEVADKNFLVTFGIEPDTPETGYGYIQVKKEKESLACDVELFHEKPKIEKAKEYLLNGNFFWNSGMFCFKAGVFLDELQKYSPEIYNASKNAFENAIKDNSIIRIQEDFMESIPENSIDIAVMEKSKKVKLIKSNIQWSDLGSFDSLSTEISSNTKNIVDIDSDNNFIYAEEENKVIATIGINDFIIVDTKDALLISKKNESQKVKEIVKKLKNSKSDTLSTHKLIHRPWGTYETLMDKNRYKIKKIIVKPGKRLSLQKHYHRSEHWVVVSGTATVTVGNNTTIIRPNESTYIKMGEIHRLENKGKIDVILIEVQVGEYTKEDDIVRLEDDYKRT